MYVYQIYYHIAIDLAGILSCFYLPPALGQIVYPGFHAKHSAPPLGSSAVLSVYMVQAIATIICAV